MAVPARTPGQDTFEAARIARKLEALVDLGFERSFAPPVQTQTVRCDARTARVTCTRPAMGTLVTVTAVGPSEQRLADAIGRAFEEMDRLVGLLSRHQGDTPVSHLNRTGRLDGPPPEVALVVGQALEFHRLTGGVFDPTVAPLVLLHEACAAAPSPALPSDAEIREALALVGAAHLTQARRRIAFARPGMVLTLDGIAKGFIVDELARALERGGVKRYLVDAGGDIRARGTKEGGAAWTVAVQDPERTGRYPDVIEVAGGAVATSGSYERAYDPDQTRFHVFDTRTGRSPAFSVSASVVAPTATAADALATSLLLMDPRAAVAFVDALRGCACLIIDRDGLALRSRSWRSAVPSEGGEVT